MNRAILSSTLIIFTALAMVFSAGTFAPFTGGIVGSGSVQAGTVKVSLNTDADGPVDLNATVGGDDNCRQALLPGESCVFDITLKNAGTISAQWDITVGFTEDVEGCFDVELLNEEAIEEGDGADGDHDPGDAHTTTLVVSMPDDSTPADMNDCQGTTVSVELTVDAIQSDTPHD